MTTYNNSNNFVEDDFLFDMLNEIPNDWDSLELLSDLINDDAQEVITVEQPIHIPSIAIVNSQQEDKTATDTRTKVDHSYVDYSLGREKLGLADTKGSKKGVFPKKLMNILGHQELTHVIGWCPHGRAFIVRDVSKFERLVLPRFFKTTQLKSFRKQLSLWGFKRITKGPDAGSYYHQFFLRGMPDLLKMMKYQKIKGTGRASVPNPDDEPNFYELAKSNPLPEVHPFNPIICSAAPITPHQAPYQASYHASCQTPRQQPASTPLNKVKSYVTDDDDSCVSSEEVLSIYSQMSFPGPFTPPPEIILIDN